MVNHFNKNCLGLYLIRLYGKLHIRFIPFGAPPATYIFKARKRQNAFEQRLRPISVEMCVEEAHGILGLGLEGATGGYVAYDHNKTPKNIEKADVAVEGADVKIKMDV